MARSIGLPARVAVGFTPGDVDPADPTLYHVKGKHAHAWPEVYLNGYGWVLFEPTPSRGAPNAGYTGVTEAQDPTSPIPQFDSGAPTHHGARALGRPRRSQPGGTDTRGERRRGGAAGRADARGCRARHRLGRAGCCSRCSAWPRSTSSPSWAVAPLRRAAAAPAGSHGPCPHRRRLEGGGRIAGRPRHRGEPGGDADGARLPRPSSRGTWPVRSCATWRPSRPGPAMRATRRRDDDVARARLGATAVTDQVKATTTAPQRLGYHLSPPGAAARGPATTGGRGARWAARPRRADLRRAPRPRLRRRRPGGAAAGRLSSPGGSAA